MAKRKKETYTSLSDKVGKIREQAINLLSEVKTGDPIVDFTKLDPTILETDPEMQTAHIISSLAEQQFPGATQLPSSKLEDILSKFGDMRGFAQKKAEEEYATDKPLLTELWNVGAGGYEASKELLDMLKGGGDIGQAVSAVSAPLKELFKGNEPITEEQIQQFMTKPVPKKEGPLSDQEKRLAKFKSLDMEITNIAVDQLFQEIQAGKVPELKNELLAAKKANKGVIPDDVLNPIIDRYKGMILGEDLTPKYKSFLQEKEQTPVQQLAEPQQETQTQGGGTTSGVLGSLGALSNKDLEALEWARNNPNHPDSQAVLSKVTQKIGY